MDWSILKSVFSQDDPQAPGEQVPETDEWPGGYDPFPRKEFAGLEPFVEGGLVAEFRAVGSRVTCNPAPSDTDEDWLVLVASLEGDISGLVDELKLSYGFEHDGSDLLDEEGNDEFGDFASMSLGKVNLIITGNEDFYRRFLAASSVARRLNLLVKADRVALFQAVLYGNAC